MMITPVSSSVMTASPLATPVSQNAAKAAVEFEAAMLTPMLADMLPANGLEGPGADVWHGFMAQAVAHQLAQQGGLGLQIDVATQLDAQMGKSGEA
jgi:Rod binding domain-containing protein